MWENAPKAEVEGMSLYLFPVSEGTKRWRFDISGRDGGKIEIPIGTYSLIVVNNDLPGIRFSASDSYRSFAADARVMANSGDLGPTGMLYGASVASLTVTPCGVSYITPQGIIKDCSRSVVRCYPDSLSTVYRVVVCDSRNAEKPRVVRARLTGIASTVLVAEASAAGSPGSTVFPLQRDTQGLTGSTTGLGTPPGIPEFNLTLTATMPDGKTYTKSFDVTSQVINSPYPKNVLIIISGVSFPDGETPPEDPDVGIDVGIDGWQQIDIDYDTSDPDSYGK